MADNSPCKIAGEAVSLPFLKEVLNMYDTVLKSSKQEVDFHDNCGRKRTLTTYIYEWRTVALSSQLPSPKYRPTASFKDEYSAF